MIDHAGDSQRKREGGEEAHTTTMKESEEKRAQNPKTSDRKIALNNNIVRVSLAFAEA